MSKKTNIILNQPILISNELADFLRKEHGTKLTRSDVTKGIFNYIKIHNLQDKQFSRIINPDKKLKQLLNISDSEQLSIFNIQKYLTLHITKIQSEPILIKESESDSDSDFNSDSDSDLDSDSESVSSCESKENSSSNLLESVTSILNNEIKKFKLNNYNQKGEIKLLRKNDDTRPICEIYWSIEDFKNIAIENKKIQQKLEKTLIKIKNYLSKNE
jgi:hypothetical protein